MSSIAATRSRELLTLDAAAELLGVSTSTVRRRITDGQRRAFRTGKRLIRIRIQDLDDLLREIPCAGRRPRSVTMSQAEQVDGRWPVVVDAEAAYEAIRSINHRAIWLSDGLPAPAVYWVLAELKSALGSGGQQALEQLGRGLAQSLGHYQVYEDDGREPSASIEAAGAALQAAADLAGQIGPLLEAAQLAIACQGYRPLPEQVGKA